MQPLRTQKGTDDDVEAGGCSGCGEEIASPPIDEVPRPVPPGSPTGMKRCLLQHGSIRPCSTFHPFKRIFPLCLSTCWPRLQAPASRSRLYQTF